MLTVSTNPAAFHPPADVHAEAVLRHLLVVVAFVAVAVTLAGCEMIWIFCLFYKYIDHHKKTSTSSSTSSLSWWLVIALKVITEVSDDNKFISTICPIASKGLALLTFALVDSVQGGRPPRLLNKSGTALFAVIAARVVLAVADDFVGPSRVREVATSRVPVAHALTSDRDVPDAVEVL